MQVRSYWLSTFPCPCASKAPWHSKRHCSWESETWILFRNRRDKTLNTNSLSCQHLWGFSNTSADSQWAAIPWWHEQGNHCPFPQLLSSPTLGTQSPGSAITAGLSPAALSWSLRGASVPPGMVRAEELQMKGREGQNLLVWAEACGSAKPAEVTVTFV